MIGKLCGDELSDPAVTNMPPMLPVRAQLQRGQWLQPWQRRVRQRGAKGGFRLAAHAVAAVGVATAVAIATTAAFAAFSVGTSEYPRLWHASPSMVQHRPLDSEWRWGLGLHDVQTRRSRMPLQAETEVTTVAVAETSGSVSLVDKPVAEPPNNADLATDNVSDTTDPDGLHVGQEMKGTVVRVVRFGIVVDVGLKDPGVVPNSAISLERNVDAQEAVSVGDELRVWVAGRNVAKQLLLSMIQGWVVSPDGKKILPDLSVFEGVPPTQWFDGRVLEVANHGVFVRLRAPGGNLDARGLVHYSMMQKDFIDHPSTIAKEGMDVKVRVISFDNNMGRLALSMVDPAEENTVNSMSGFENISPSQWLNGTVVDLGSFGVGVVVTSPEDGSKYRGVVPVTRLHRHFRHEPSEAYTLGDNVQVRVDAVDMPNSRLSFTMLGEDGKRAMETTALENLSGDVWLNATVRRIMPFGAFVVVALPADETGNPIYREGLIHVSEMAEFMVNNPEDVVKVGEDIRVRFLSVSDEGKAAFTMKDATDDNEALAAFLEISPEEWMNAAVASVVDFGLFVNLAPPRGGKPRRCLVHISQIPSIDRRTILDKAQVGQQIRVRLVSVDESGRLSCSMLEPNTKAVELEPESDEPVYGEEALAAVPDAEITSQKVDSRKKQMARKNTKKGADVTPKEPGGLVDFLDESTLSQCLQSLLDQGYDSVELLKDLDATEWAEMRQACKLRPGDVAKLRRALGRGIDS